MRVINCILILNLLLVFILLESNLAGATIYYVATNGSNSNNGSFNTPWLTIQHAVDTVNPGDSVYIMGGTYNESIFVQRSGNSTNPITLANYNGQVVSINGSSNPALSIPGGKQPQYWIIEGLKFFSTGTYTVRKDTWNSSGSCLGADHWTLQYNYISGAITMCGAYTVFANNEVDGSQNDGNGGNAVQEVQETSHDNIFRDNNIHDFSKRGIWTEYRTHDSLFEGNNIHDIAVNSVTQGACLDTDGYASVEWRQIIRNNTFQNCGLQEIQIENLFDSVIENNIISGTATGGYAGMSIMNYGPDNNGGNPAIRWCEVAGESNQYGDTNGDNSCEGDMTNITVRQNLIYNHGDSGIVVYYAGGVSILGNTIVGNASSSWGIAIGPNSTGAPQEIMQSNIVTGDSDAEIFVLNTSSLTVDKNNLLFNSNINHIYKSQNGPSNWIYRNLSQYQTLSGNGQNSNVADPQFVNASSMNFHLQSTSPAIDSGININLSYDIEGNPRPQGNGYDIGAYEYNYTGNIYYVSNAGNDSWDGKSQTNSGNSGPWKTLSNVNSASLQPGDTVLFRKGDFWNGELIISVSGISGLPISFSSYGSGALPVISNPLQRTAISMKANWTLVEQIKASDTNDSAVRIEAGANNDIVRNMEIAQAGGGVAVQGQYNLVTQNYIHDLHMIVNTPGGNDDYGAVGIWLYNSNNEVSYNNITGCIAPSYDYGTDGGAIELYGNTDNNTIHHNYANGCNGFMEIGGGTAYNTIVSQNIAVNSQDMLCIHLTGVYKSNLTNFRLEHNTIVDLMSNYTWAMLVFDGVPTPQTLIVQNNIFYVDNYSLMANQANFSHNNNIFFNNNSKGTLGFNLSTGDIQVDPMFVDVNGLNFHLKAGSPAIDAGANLNYSIDFEGNPRPQGHGYDIGAFESNYSTLSIIFQTCNDSATFNYQSYQVYNNKWNKGSLNATDTYYQCFWTESLQYPWIAGWNWSWPKKTGQVKAYPEIIYGWMPGHPNTTDSHLPILLSNMGSFVASFETSTLGIGATYNTAFDIWLGNSSTSALNNRTSEVMIWIDYQNPWVNPVPNLGRITVDGQDYDVTMNNGTTKSLIVFKKVVPMQNGSVTIDHFLNILMNSSLINTSKYLYDIEFGNEIVNGTGNTTIWNYSITYYPLVLLPTIDLLWPINSSSQTSSNSVNFHYQLNYSAVINNCSLIIDNVVNHVNSSVIANSDSYFTQTLANGDHVWFISCYTQNGDVNSSFYQLNLNYQAPVNNPPSGGGSSAGNHASYAGGGGGDGEYSPPIIYNRTSTNSTAINQSNNLSSSVAPMTEHNNTQTSSLENQNQNNQVSENNSKSQNKSFKVNLPKPLMFFIGSSLIIIIVASILIHNSMPKVKLARAVSLALKKGYSVESIRNQLLSLGWDEKSINKVLLKK